MAPPSRAAIHMMPLTLPRSVAWNQRASARAIEGKAPDSAAPKANLTTTRLV